MPTNSCICIPPDDHFIVLHQWMLDYCDGDRCAALLLSVFIYFHDLKFHQPNKFHNADITISEREFLQYYTKAKLSELTMKCYSHSAIDIALNLLAHKGAISIQRNINPHIQPDRAICYLLHPDTINAWINAQYQQKSRRANTQPGAKVKRSEDFVSILSHPHSTYERKISQVAPSPLGIDQSADTQTSPTQEYDENQNLAGKITARLIQLGLHAAWLRSPPDQRTIAELLKAGAEFTDFEEAAFAAIHAKQGSFLFKRFAMAYLKPYVLQTLAQRKYHQIGLKPRKMHYVSDLTNMQDW